MPPWVLPLLSISSFSFIENAMMQKKMIFENNAKFITSVGIPVWYPGDMLVWSNSRVVK
jgi:hypothetical protein